MRARAYENRQAIVAFGPRLLSALPPSLRGQWRRQCQRSESELHKLVIFLFFLLTSYPYRGCRLCAARGCLGAGSRYYDKGTKKWRDDAVLSVVDISLDVVSDAKARDALARRRAEVRMCAVECSSSRAKGGGAGETFPSRSLSQ